MPADTVPRRDGWCRRDRLAAARGGCDGIHMNSALVSAGPYSAGGNRAGTRGGRRAHHIQGERLWLLPRAGHAAADDRLRTAGFTGRPGGMDARPRHRQLLQDLPRLRRRPALGQSHPRPHPRQHHDLLADGHRRLGGPVLLGEWPSHSSHGGPDSSAGVPPGRVHHVPRRDLPGPAQLGREVLPPPSAISTRSTREVTSPPGKSRNCSQPRSARRSDRSASREPRTDERGPHLSLAARAG